MNVLYLINYAGKAGTEKYIENLVRILSRDKITAFLAYDTEGELSDKLKAMGVKTLRLDMGRLLRHTAGKKLASFCRENAIDVIHVQYPWENQIAITACRHLKSLRVVMTNHIVKRHSGLYALHERQINRLYTPKNHKIIAVSNEAREIMIENGIAQHKLEVIFNGIEPIDSIEKSNAIRKELSLPEDCFLMTIFARFTPERGLDFLIDVLYNLKLTAKRKFCCVICGDGALVPEIRSRVLSLGLQDECRLLGYRKDAKDILRASDAYLCTSSKNEAMSFAILEAMNAGLPLVLTNVGGNRDLAENKMKCGFCLSYGDVKGFSKSILSLMNDPSLHERLSLAASEKIKKYFDVNKLALDVYNTYR